MSNAMNKEIKDLLTAYIAHIDFRIIFINSHKIASYCRAKEPLSPALRSDIIYKYECEECSSSYIGQSSKCARARWSQHLGISDWTNRPLGVVCQSAPRDHSEVEKHRISMQNFKIINQNASLNYRLILESLEIFNRKPNLNSMVSSVPLNIVK